MIERTDLAKTVQALENRLAGAERVIAALITAADEAGVDDIRGRALIAFTSDHVPATNRFGPIYLEPREEDEV